MDKVSIILPVYNHEKYIERCLDSIFNQTYPNLEIIIIDDGSRDNSPQIVARKIKGRKNTCFIIQKNQGAHFTINKGILMSKGKYINIINSDDFFSHNRIARMVEEIKKKQTRFIFSKVNYVDHKDKDITIKNKYTMDLLRRQNSIKDFASVGYALLLSNVTISTGNMFFDKKLYDEVGGFNNYKYVHDWDFVLRCLKCTEPIFLDEVHYYYRYHDENSFKSLKDVAAYECPALMKNYFKIVHLDTPRNKLAPARSNWPLYFDYFISKHEYWVYVNG